MDLELICMVMALHLSILILYAIGNILSAATFLLCDSVFLSVVGGSENVLRKKMLVL